MMTHITTVNHEYQWTNLCQVVQNFLRKWQVIRFVSRPLIFQPATILFDPAFCFGNFWRMSGNRWQLAALPLYHPCNQRCQCVQMTGKVPLRFNWKQLFQRYSNGTIYSTVVTHWATSVLSSWKKLSVTHVATVLC